LLPKVVALPAVVSAAFQGARRRFRREELLKRLLRLQRQLKSGESHVPLWTSISNGAVPCVQFA